jgi:Uma2 family endonuclease
MVTTLVPAEQRVVLSGISWETYERLLAEHDGRASPRFTYDRGDLEIMVISFEHEELNRLLHDLFTVVADEVRLDFINAGSTTLKREDLERGFEPDTSFYIENAGRVHGRKRIDLPSDPPPDLVIEVDVSGSSMDKMAIYASMEIREVWRHDGNELHIFTLEGKDFRSQNESAALPELTADVITRFIEERKTESRPVWLQRVREWIRQQQKR